MMSNSRHYAGKFIPITHEYLLIWARKQVTLAQVAWNKASELQNGIHNTWRNFVRLALMNCGGKADLATIYKQVEQIAAEKVRSNTNYQAKIRQTLQHHFANVERGVWAVAA